MNINDMLEVHLFQFKFHVLRNFSMNQRNCDVSIIKKSAFDEKKLMEIAGIIIFGSDCDEFFKINNELMRRKKSAQMKKEQAML